MDEHFRRRHLPHWDLPGATYFVTSCLAGSIPARGLLDLQRFEEELTVRSRPPKLSERAWRTQQGKLMFSRREEWLDREPAVRHFDQEELAAELRQALYHFAGERYELIAYVVMPSHFHLAF